MSEQDRISFENWYISEHCKDLSEISINEVMAKTSLGVYSSFHVNGAYSGWQAATAEANKRIDALEGEIAELKQERNDLNYLCMERLHKIEELQANNNDLREALKLTLGVIAGETLSKSFLTKALEKSKMALSATPAESLQAFENEVIEKVYQVVENISDSSRTSVEILEAIRALKEVK